MFIRELFGRMCEYRGGRWFALEKAENRAGRVAIASHDQMRGSAWSRVMNHPMGSRVIVNQKRADARRDARWRRVVVKARFT